MLSDSIAPHESRNYDRFPVTPEGRIVAAMLMTASVGLFGTFSGYVASWFLSGDRDFLFGRARRRTAGQEASPPELRRPARPDLWPPAAGLPGRLPKSGWSIWRTGAGCQGGTWAPGTAAGQTSADPGAKGGARSGDRSRRALKAV